MQSWVELHSLYEGYILHVLILLYIHCEEAPFNDLNPIKQRCSKYSVETFHYLKILSIDIPGFTTTSVCQLPCLLYPWDPVWPSDPVLLPTLPGTDAVETEPTTKAPEPTPPVQAQQNVSSVKNNNL